MLKTSQINTANDRNLRDDQYALIVMDKEASYKLFPTTSRDDTMRSCIEFNNYCYDLGPGEQKTAAHFLKEACKTWGIGVPPSVEGMVPSAAEIGYNNVRINEVPLQPLVKAASANHQFFALDGIKRYAIDTPELCKKASDYFDKHWFSFGPSDRRDFAKAVQSRSSDLGVDTSDKIHKFAADTYNVNLHSEIIMRRNSTRDENLKVAYDRLMTYKNDIKVEKFAEYLGALDKKAGFAGLYSDGAISDPLTATVGVPLHKKASIAELDGVSYDAAAILDALGGLETKSPALFGPTMIKQLKNNPELFASLPMPEQKVILSYAT